MEPIKAEVTEPKITVKARDMWEVWEVRDGDWYAARWFWNRRDAELHILQSGSFNARLVHISLPAID